MNEFYVELRAFRTRNQAHRELQAFVRLNLEEVMDEGQLKKFKTELIRKSWEIGKKYPGTSDLDVQFSTYNPLGHVQQFIRVRSNFRLAIRGKVETRIHKPALDTMS